MVTADARAQAIRKVASHPVLVFKFITEGSARPTALGVISLVVEACAIDVGNGIERKIECARRPPNILDTYPSGRYIARRSGVAQKLVN